MEPRQLAGGRSPIFLFPPLTSFEADCVMVLKLPQKLGLLPSLFHILVVRKRGDGALMLGYRSGVVTARGGGRCAAAPPPPSKTQNVFSGADAYFPPFLAATKGKKKGEGFGCHKKSSPLFLLLPPPPFSCCGRKKFFGGARKKCRFFLPHSDERGAELFRTAVGGSAKGDDDRSHAHFYRHAGSAKVTRGGEL